MKKKLDSCKILGDLVTVENAEEYYKEYNGNIAYAYDGSDIKFYVQHFTKEDFLKWNVDIVKRMIDEYKEADKLTYTDAGEVWKHFWNLAYLTYMVYVENRDIYLQRIELLKEMYKKYGYFMSYSTFGCSTTIDTEHYEFIVHTYWCADPMRCLDSDYRKSMSKYPTESFFYDSSRKRTGLVPDLYYLGYHDLLDKYLEECFLPICLHYKEKNEYYKLYNMFDGEVGKDIRTDFYITDPIEFLRKQNYKLPKELDEFWKERGL